MFGWWGRAVVRARWWVLAASALFALVGSVWGMGVFGSLSGGGFDDPASPSSRAHERIAAELGRQGPDVVVLYSSTEVTVDEPAMRDPVRDVLTRLGQRAEVLEVQSYYNTGSLAMVSADRHATYLAIQLRGGEEDDKVADLDAIRPDLLVTGAGADATLTHEIGGLFAFLDDANSQVESDIIRAELLSLPILAVLMVLIFRGLVAAGTPLLVGAVAILGAFTVTRVLAGFTEISVFAANVITMLGLGMAIDYALFVVSRFREELAAGHATAAAVARTVATAGRTVVVSGVTVALALSSLLLFPMGFLKSIGYGGMAAVLVAMIAALTALPALLAVLGPRVNALRVRLPFSRRSPDGTGRVDGGWARLARSVMRRPVLYLIGVSIVLVVIASAFVRASFGGFDERVLPVGTPSRTVAERLTSDFPGGGTPVLALVTGAGPEAAQAFADQARALPGVSDATVTAGHGASALVTITHPGGPATTQARDLVIALRALPAPPGTQVLVGGRAAADLDQIESLARRLVPMALYVGSVTALLLFLAFGSVVLPIKAILMNVISIGASFGVVVWIFQDGHLAGWLGFTPTGFLEPTNLILMLAVLFGLSTDYEVFLLSRVREEWDRTGDNTEAVAAGLQRTGGIITAAALLLIVVIGGFATGGTATIKMLGVGTVVAVAVDAAAVRTLLVPATMRLLGRWNWWAPGPLARLYRSHGLSEPGLPATEHAGASTAAGP